MALEFTDDNIMEIIDSGKPVVIDFWAEWCGPCRMVAPSIAELSKEYGDRVAIGKMDVDEHSDIPSKYGIRNIPTVLFIKNGEVVDKQVGAAPKAVLEEKVKAML